MAKSKSVSVVTGLVPLRISDVKMKKNQKSEVARQTRPKLMAGPNRQSNSSLLPPRGQKRAERGQSMSQNDDLADFLDESEKPKKPPLAGNRRSLAKQNENKSALVKAGMSASRKGLFESNSNENQSQIQIDNRTSEFEKSPQRNLDEEGTSQLTYPN